MPKPYPIDRLSQKSGKYLKRKILALLTFSFPFKSKMRAHKISKTWGAKSKFRSQNLTTKLTQTKTARGSLADCLLNFLSNCFQTASLWLAVLRSPKTKLLLNCSSFLVDLHTKTPEICSKIHFQHTDKRVAVSAGHRRSLEAVSLAVLLSRIRFGGKFSL